MLASDKKGGGVITGNNEKKKKVDLEVLKTLRHCLKNERRVVRCLVKKSDLSR